VTSVPYWDERCGHRFESAKDFTVSWDLFWENVNAGRYSPRDYILENLTLEKCAQLYLGHLRDAGAKAP
jgi:hypothetical protein